MYNPLDRLRTFLPCVPRVLPAVPTEEEPIRHKKYSNAKKKTVLVHVVDVAQFTKELGSTKTNIKDMCDDIPHMMVALGTATTEAKAKTFAKTFGTGNLMIYILRGTMTDPEYLAVGETEGCAVDGCDVKGSWRVWTTFGGSKNPFVTAAVECSFINSYKRIFYWDIQPVTHLGTHKPCFIKAYHPKFFEVYADVCAERRKGVSEEDIIRKDPVTRRLIVLVELLFTWKKSVEASFLHFVAENGK